MKYVLYDILLHISVVALFPYFLFKMATARKYREGIPERFGFFARDKFAGLKRGPVVWIHAVSVGETKAILPVLKLFRERHPEVKVLFSTVTMTGNRTASNDGKGLIDALIYFPFDISWVLKRVLRATNPVALVVVEKEIWPNLFHQLRSSSVPVIVANGTISDRSFRRYARFSFIFRSVFEDISFFCARTGADLEKAVKCGVDKDRVVLAGNLKFDLKPPAPDPSYIVSLRKSLGIKETDMALVAGSTHPGEEEIVLRAYRECGITGLKLVIAPRHPERFSEVEAIIKRHGLKYSKRSTGGAEDVVLLDTVGELMTVYSFSTVALVCGSLAEGIGGHNLLEPAYFSKPVVYGSHLTTYLNMAEMLEEAGGGVRAGDGELGAVLKRLFSDNGLRKELGEKARKVVEENRGAAARTVEVMERFLR
ncbi:MAG: 3-deoxy-D-manno-octulosonic acid transferase [Deltaproteobacteria bacterium]|nr:3-deoxy-D-manno-octulosonic acid transferase [Deltaproteobacteria bacterium]